MKTIKDENIKGFICMNCKSFVPINPEMGTIHRNHCNNCLWSKHVDNNPGDRASKCGAGMEPIAVTLKIEGQDKYTGNQKLGDVMLVHRCLGCNKYVVNRVAADDSPSKILEIFDKSQLLSNEEKLHLQSMEINILEGPAGKKLLSERLYGKI